jgi:hypothetical protein
VTRLFVTLRFLTRFSHMSSIYSSSTAPSSTSSSVIGRAIALDCPAEDVSELKFSLANGVYVVAKKRQSNMTENVIYVYAWSMENDRRRALPSSSIVHDVCMRSNISHTLLTY